MRNILNAKPENVDSYVRACIVLHNFLMSKADQAKGSLYFPPGFADQITETGEIRNGDWRKEVNMNNSAFENAAVLQGRNYSADAFQVREEFVNYFNSVGSVPWQTERAGVNEIYRE